MAMIVLVITDTAADQAPELLIKSDPDLTQLPGELVNPTPAQRVALDIINSLVGNAGDAAPKSRLIQTLS